MRIVGLLAMGVLTVSSLFTILAKPQAFASLFNANRDLAMNSDLLMVGAKLKEPISAPISYPISGPVRKPKVTEMPLPTEPIKPTRSLEPTKQPPRPKTTATPTPGPLTGTVVPLTLTPTMTPVAPTPQSTSNKRVFLTSTKYSGNLGGLAGADQKCQDSATSANLGGTWKAWVSDVSSSVTSRFVRTSGNYVLLDGSVIAHGWADLTDGTLLKSINLNEYSTAPTYTSCIWTSTDTRGSFVPVHSNVTGCNGYTSASTEYSSCGINGSSDYNWTKWDGGDQCNSSNPLYCFEQ